MTPRPPRGRPDERRARAGVGSAIYPPARAIK